MRRLLTLLLLASSLPLHADMMMKTHSVLTDSGAPANVEPRSEHTTIYYRQDSMRRKETAADTTMAAFFSIANCETRAGLTVDSGAREYRTYKVIRFWPSAQWDDYGQKNGKLVQIESKTVDTGERKLFFRHVAKHFITTVTRAPDDTNAGVEEITDGWYIDHELPDANCAPDYARSEPFYVIGTMSVTPPQVAHFHHTGPVPTGLAVKRTHIDRTRSKDGRERILKSEETVEELSDAPVSPSLFQLPAGYRENPKLFGSQPRMRDLKPAPAFGAKQP